MLENILSLVLLIIMMVSCCKVEANDILNNELFINTDRQDITNEKWRSRNDNYREEEMDERFIRSLAEDLRKWDSTYTGNDDTNLEVLEHQAEHLLKNHDDHQFYKPYNLKSLRKSDFKKRDNGGINRDYFYRPHGGELHQLQDAAKHENGEADKTKRRRLRRDEDAVNQPSTDEARKGTNDDFLKDKLPILKHKTEEVMKNADETFVDQEGKIYEVTSTSVGLRSQPYQCLYAINKVRELHNMRPVRWNTYLAYMAQEWALVMTEKMSSCSTHNLHSKMHYMVKVGDGEYMLGENLYASENEKYIDDCAEAVNTWYTYVLFTSVYCLHFSRLE